MVDHTVIQTASSLPSRLHVPSITGFKNTSTATDVSLNFHFVLENMYFKVFTLLIKFMYLVSF